MQSVQAIEIKYIILPSWVTHPPKKVSSYLPQQKNCTKNFQFDTMSPSWESWVTKYLQPEMDEILKAEENIVSQSQGRDRLAWRKGKGCRWDRQEIFSACMSSHARQV